MRPANERWSHMLSPIGWVHAQNDPWRASDKKLIRAGKTYVLDPVLH